MRDTKDLDAVTSQACTRAGAFALLISLALVSLSPNWIRQQNLIALGNYVTLRAELNITVEHLGQNPYWKIHLSKVPNAESQPLKQLLEVAIEMVGVGRSIKLDAGASSGATSTAGIAPRLEAPKNMRLMTNIVEIFDIVEILKNLNDSSLLTRGRNASSLADYSIYRWALKRNSMIQGNQTATPWLMEKFSPPALKRSQQLPEGYVPSVPSEDLINYLTVNDVRELAKSMPPIFDDGIRVADVREAPVEVSPGALPKNLFWATLSAQLLLAFVIAYFAFFMREATSSAGFPAPGTLFGVFSRSYGAQFVFVAAIAAPLLASVVVAVVSEEWMVRLATGFILAASAYVFTVARRAGLCPCARGEDATSLRKGLDRL